LNGTEAVKAYESRFKTPPYDHQRSDVAALYDHDFYGLFNEMGTGKTKTVIDAACILYEEKKINTVLVVSPAAVRTVWLNQEFGEIKKHAWVPVCTWEFHSRMQRVWQDKDPKLNFIVTNYEFLRSEKHQEELHKLLHKLKVMMVLDESSFIKNPRAIQTKACTNIGKLMDRRVILNGTPIANNPLDLWAQSCFLSPRILPYKWFGHFRSEYAVFGGWHNKQILRFQNLDKLQNLLAPYVIRREKRDCLDLPEKIFTQLEVKLDEKTWDTYKTMRDEAVVWMDENPTMAAQAGVRVMRLAQITSGFLGGFQESETAEPHTEEIGSEKLDALREWVQARVDENPEVGIIVWCRFRAELERVAASLADILPTYRLYGQGAVERREAIDAFTKPGGKARLLAAQPQAGGFGLNLQRGTLVVYMSNDFSLMARLQSEDRCHRPGQRSNVVYTDVLATGPKGQKTVDHTIVKVLRSKNDLAQWTVAAWKEALRDE